MRIFFDFEFIENGNAFVMEPISIGMVREDGEEYYAEFQGVDWTKANEWVKDNVRPYLTGPIKRKHTIVREILEFVGEKPEFWAYFADYDWVLLCQLFGRMVDLPKGWPYFCLDVKQLMWSYNLKKEDLQIPNDQEHHALADARWNKHAFNAISDEIRGGRLHIVRPGENYRSSDMGQSGQGPSFSSS